MDDKERYPIGQQDFKTLRIDDAYYIDKTAFVAKIARSKSKYYFLARPRRFGKSLFLSTLRYFFEGERDLFRGLYIDSDDWDWEAYPVLYLDLNTDKYAESWALEDVLETIFMGWEAKYGITERMDTYSQRFKTIIRQAHEKTGKQVIILVDEYDKPLVGNLHNDENFEHYRTKLASLYSNFKSSAEHIRLVFLTGVSRFSKLSVFSDLNNLKDITFSNEYADICGITENELLENFHQGIEALAMEYEISFDEARARLKSNYDGYRFAKKGSEIYNPWSLLNCMQDRCILNYWNATGAASVVAETLQDADIDIEKTLNARWRIDDLAGLDLLSSDPTALLYQAGYLTIADYDRDTDTIGLKVPNEEVRKGLFDDLLKLYVKVKGKTVKNVLDGIKDGIRFGNPEEMMKNIDSYFVGVPYDLKVQNENNFHNALYILLTLIGIEAKAEAHTSDGRIDLIIETPNFIYLIELKYDSTPQQALRQIEEKEYARKFSTDYRKLFKIGVSFSSEKRRIGAWIIKS